MRIGLRILLGYFLIVALAAFLLGRVFVQEVKPGVRQAMEDTLVDMSNLLAAQAKDELLAGRINDGQFAASVRAATKRDLGAEIWGFGKRQVSTRVYVTDAQGIVVFDSSGTDVGKDYSSWNDVYLTLRGRYGARSTRSDPQDDSSSVMHVAAPIVDRIEGKDVIVGVLTVAKPNQTIEPFIARSQRTILHWGWLLLGSALLIGLTAAWWLSRQLGTLRKYAVAVTAGERAAPPEAAGEFGDLGRALATMRERLEGKQYVEQYVHALTHELKSPLAAIRASAELVEAGGATMPADERARFVATIRVQGDRLSQMIDKLLALAAVEHRQQIERPETVDLARVISGAANDVAAKFSTRALSLRFSDTQASVQGDSFLLHQAIVNLLDNAADFAPSGSAIDISVTRDGPNWTLAVADRGPGVPEFALPRAFERFYSLPRPGGASRSSGLGLCFVAEVAALHGGHAMLGNRPGGGAIAKLSLPA